MRNHCYHITAKFAVGIKENQEKLPALYYWALSWQNEADIIEAFNSTSRYLDDLLNIDNVHFEQMVDRIYHTELQLSKANSSDTEAPFLDLNLSKSNGT